MGLFSVDAYLNGVKGNQLRNKLRNDQYLIGKDINISIKK